MTSADHLTASDYLRPKSIRDYTRQQCLKTLTMVQPVVNGNSGEVEDDTPHNLHM